MVTSPSAATCTKTLGRSSGADFTPGAAASADTVGTSPRARPPTERLSPSRKERRVNTTGCWLIASSLLRVRHARGLLHGRADARVRPTAAEVARERLVDVRVRGLGLLRQQRRRAHELPGLAEPTLRHAQLHPGALERMASIRRQSLDGGDLASVRATDGRHACAHHL